MKNLRKIYGILFSLIVFSNHASSAKSFGAVNEQSMHEKVDRYFHYLYDQIPFQKGHVLQYPVFAYALQGYYNLQEAGKIKPGALLTVCDFSLSANQKRMWVIDLNAKKVLFNTLVAHGMGTGEEYATTFSNQEQSHQSSLGFYATGETYEGAHGLSLKLYGEDGMFNNKAYERGIVIHSASYVSEDFARTHKRIGRSHGCPALPVEIAPVVINQIRNGSCLFIYHPSESYLQSSAWLRKSVRQLPSEADRINLLTDQRAMATLEEKHEAQNTASAQARPDQKSASAPSASAPKVTSIIIVHENDRIGSSDTLRIQ